MFPTQVTPLLAHPLTEPGRLEIPPLAAAVVAMVIVVSVARFWPGRTIQPEPSVQPAERHGWPVHSWYGPLPPALVATRVLAVALLVLAVVAGRVGSEDELANLAPALVVGAGWPLLLAGSLLLGAVWRWLDPWDGFVRAMDRGQGDEPVPHVVWAVVPAAGLAWYLGASTNPYAPRTVGLALAVYSVVTVGGCLLVGRRRWLSRAEVFGLLFSWSAIVRKGRASTWTPPRGAELVLGVVAGGLVFSTVRRSALWGGLNVVPSAMAYATFAVVALAAGFAIVLWWLEWKARDVDAPGSVPAAVVPAVVGVALALAMYADVLFTSISLLPQLLVDPLGRGWSFVSFEVPLLAFCPETISCSPLVAVQTAVLMAGAIWGAILLARRVPSAADRQPGMAALCLIVAGGVVAVTAS